VSRTMKRDSVSSIAIDRVKDSERRRSADETDGLLEAVGRSPITSRGRTPRP
jgi:hypothetical protein